MTKWLMVDDDPEDQEIFQLALGDVNYPIELALASNGLDALEKLNQMQNGNLPDLIFLDINMGEMDGRECIVELKKDQRFAEIPVLIYSTSSDVRDINSLTELGAARFITKPTNVTALTEILKEVAHAYHKPL